MNRLFSLAAMLFVCGTFSQPAAAVNNLFLPGDAFFPTTLTQETVERLQQAPVDKRVFEYSSLGGYEFAFCGYAGYGKAIFEELDEPFFEKLMAVYREVREGVPRDLREIKENGKTRFIELNGVGVLFYPASMPNKPVMGLRYNENWSEEVARFGHPRERQRLCCLIEDPLAVMLSWRDAKAFPALGVQRPKGDDRRHPDKQEPVVIRGPLQAVVLGFSTPEELFKITDDDWHEVHTITATGIEVRREEFGETRSLQWRQQAAKWLPPTDSDWLNEGDDEPF